MPRKHFKSEYIDFRNSVVVGNQFVLNEQAQAFLGGIRKSAETRVATLPKGLNVFRAQHGCVQKDWDEEPIFLLCHNKKRMLPDRSHVRAGRAKAEYKTVFYASVTPEIAVKETRPWSDRIYLWPDFESRVI